VGPFDLIAQKNTRDAVLWLDEFSGDYKVLGESLLETLRDLLLIKIGVLTPVSSDKYSKTQFEELKNLADQLPRPSLKRANLVKKGKFQLVKRVTKKKKQPLCLRKPLKRLSQNLKKRLLQQRL
jgi:hypothetical protein